MSLFRCIFIVFAVPEVLSLLRSIRVVLLKHVSRPTWDKFLVVWALETAHVTGLCLLFFGVLPELDSFKAAMATNAASTIPALLRLSNLREKFGKSWMRIMAMMLNLICLLAQVAGLVIWDSDACRECSLFV
jgi:hypothetical protein